MWLWVTNKPQIAVVSVFAVLLVFKGNASKFDVHASACGPSRVIVMSLNSFVINFSPLRHT